MESVPSGLVDLSITRKEAAKYIEDYFHTYPGIKAFLDDAVAHAKENGYVKTLFDGDVRCRSLLPAILCSALLEKELP